MIALRMERRLVYLANSRIFCFLPMANPMGLFDRVPFSMIRDAS